MYVDRNEGVYNIKLNLSDIEIHGLSTIYLNEEGNLMRQGI